MANIDYDELFNKEAFKNIDSETKQQFKEIYTQLQGKNPTEMLQILMRNASVFQKGRKISSQEQALMIEALRQSVPEDERKNLDKILSLMQSFHTKG